MRTPQNNRLNEQKEFFRTCVLHFGTFLCRALQNNVKWPNFRFSWECEHITAVHMEPFSTLVFKVLIWIFATTTNDLWAVGGAFLTWQSFEWAFQCARSLSNTAKWQAEPFWHSHPQAAWGAFPRGAFLDHNQAAWGYHRLSCYPTILEILLHMVVNKK